MHGNAWEWVADCWNANYNNAFDDQSVNKSGDCTRAVLRGRSWILDSNLLHSSERSKNPKNMHLNTIGFRLALSKGESDYHEQIDTHHFTMKAIPAGSFEMGCDQGQTCYPTQRPKHNVAIKPFYLAETPTTNALFALYAKKRNTREWLLYL